MARLFPDPRLTYDPYRELAAATCALAGLGQASGGRLVPVSDRKAIAAAIRLFAGGGRGELGQSIERAAGIASTAASGAKIGSIIPGVGTVIGGVVGAAVGWLTGRKKPRVSHEQFTECQNFVREYMNMAAGYPGQPVPLELETIRQIGWCLTAVYGGEIDLREPQFFFGHVDDFVKIARAIVRRIYETPVGHTVQLSDITIAIAGRGSPTGPLQGADFANPPFTSLANFVRDPWTPMALKYCDIAAGKYDKKRRGCSGYYNRPEWQRWFLDLLFWAARTELPNISEEDLRAASQVAQTMPGKSARDVVSAVEQIIQRQVAPGETASLIDQAGPPPMPQPAPTPKAGEQAEPAPPLPALPQGATNEQLRAALQELTAQIIQERQASGSSASQAAAAATQAAMQWLAAQGIQASPQDVEDIVHAGPSAGSSLPWVVAAAAVLFAFARPAPRRRAPRKRKSKR